MKHKELLCFEQPQQVATSKCTGYKAFSIKAENITEIDTFKERLSMVAHELRTPLAVIVGYAGILKRHLSTTIPPSNNSISDMEVQEKGLDTITHSIEVILKQAKEMNQLITQLYDFSTVQHRKLEANQIEVVDLARLVEQVVTQQILIRPSHYIQLEAGKQDIKVVCDKGRIEQVFNNLINNAVKYSPIGSKVTVGYEVANATDVTIWVQDEGCGIEQAEQEHIFEQFSRGTDQVCSHIEGLGLGLYLCRSIVQQHGGKIWLKSQPGVGSTFYFSLPLHQ